MRIGYLDREGIRVGRQLSGAQPMTEQLVFPVQWPRAAQALDLTNKGTKGNA